MRALLLFLTGLCLAGCGDPAAWDRASQLAAQARAQQAETQRVDADAADWSAPLWVDVARECSRVMPWHPGYAEARSLREAIEAGRLQALEAPQPATPAEAP